MDVFNFIDSNVSRKLLPYIRLVSVYIKDGNATGICLNRYTDKNIVKKAKKVGLNQDRMMKNLDKPVKLQNINDIKIEKGEYYLNYDTSTKELTIYRM